MPTVMINSYTRQRRVVSLPLLQRLGLRLGLVIFLQERIYPGWSGYLKFYAFKCPACKQYHDDYPHGFDGDFFCPIVNTYVNVHAPPEPKPLPENACNTCGGNGVVPNPMWFGGLSPLYTIEPMEIVCPACGGKGVKPNES